MKWLYCFSDSEPPIRLKVILAGNADKHVGGFNGLYVLNLSQQVNNFPYWLRTNETAAIWWDKKNSSWSIGSKTELGKTICGIHAPFGDERNPNLIQSNWKYFVKKGVWNNANSNEVIIQDCSDEVDAPDKSTCKQS